MTNNDSSHSRSNSQSQSQLHLNDSPSSDPSPHLLVSPISPPLIALAASPVVHPQLRIQPHGQPQTPPSESRTTSTSNSHATPKKAKKPKTKKTSIVNQGSRFPAYTPNGERQCTNCSEIDTPQWRGTLCNACALWKRSRGTDRPLPLLFPVRRKSPSPEPEDEKNEELDGDEGADEIKEEDGERVQEAGRGEKIGEKDLRNNSSLIIGKRKFWIDRPSSTAPETESHGFLDRGRLGLQLETLEGLARRPGIGIGTRGSHMRTVSHQSHIRPNSISIPSLSIPANAPPTGRINGIHSTPVSPTNPIIPTGGPDTSQLDVDVDARNDIINGNAQGSDHHATALQNRIAALMSQVHDHDKRKRRNSMPNTGTYHYCEGSSEDGHVDPASGSGSEAKGRGKGKGKSPYLPYSLDKRKSRSKPKSKSNLGKSAYQVSPISPQVPNQSQNANRNQIPFQSASLSRSMPYDNDVEEEIRPDDDANHVGEMDMKLDKGEFMKGAEWLFDILQSTSKLLRHSHFEGEGTTQKDDAHDPQRTLDQGGLDILGKVAEEARREILDGASQKVKHENFM
ncbi:uncharacterized protein IL334_001155 [Kwoniella shivajii]|uniref:GATA-type domain-containing protein n=1 Tax=Kwoniella shivajii TaxID=564305 RepID=A0ABZ1CR57_9TREE|nr:hypothetical protein IL334_001155 [Kwoniella shivajii]